MWLDDTIRLIAWSAPKLGRVEATGIERTRRRRVNYLYVDFHKVRSVLVDAQLKDSGPMFCVVKAHSPTNVAIEGSRYSIIQIPKKPHSTADLEFRRTPSVTHVDLQLARCAIFWSRCDFVQQKTCQG